MIGRPEDVFSELKFEAYRNAACLFRDGCTLYGAGSYASAYALAVLSFEEVGKVHGIDRVCDAICLNRAAETNGLTTAAPLPVRGAWN